MRLPLAAALAALAATAAPAAAAPVLHVGPDAAVVREDPYLPPRAETDLVPPPARVEGGRDGSRPGARSAARTSVRAAVRQAAASGEITTAQRREWMRTFRRAKRTRRRLDGVRRAQMTSQIKTLKRIAAADQLTASRMPALFLQLGRNTEYWPNQSYPASGQRVEFSESELVFQHYPGYGLQIQPLANFGKANALWRSGRAERLRLLLDELVAIASRRGRFLTWEYWFRFGGGNPPWMSAMAHGTAIQALSRASDLLGEPAYARVARRGIRAFSTRAPTGVKVRGRAGGKHYLIYSFSKGLRVLNAFAQSLNGLHDYGTITGHARALRLFEKGDISLRAELPAYDTGAWTLYSLGGAEATLEYHELASDFLANLCERVAAAEYCDAAARFQGYVTESPRLALHTSRLVEKNRQYIRFELSKRSLVRLTISRNEAVVYSASAWFPYGARSFAWTPPRPGEYVVTLAAESFNGMQGSAGGTITVRKRAR